MTICYQELINFVKNKTHYRISQKKKYSIITLPKTKYHITIFQDQWDNYHKETGLPYHLFHISSDQIENRCSSYFWMDFSYQIHQISEKYFKYEQPDFSFSASTRKPCEFDKIKMLLKVFRKIFYSLPK